VRKLCPYCKKEHIAEEKVRNIIIGKVGRYIKNKNEIKIYKALE